MLGAIIGDIIGSRFELNNIKSKDFKLFTKDCRLTDDSMMTIAIAKAILNSKDDYSDLESNAIKYMQEIGRKYPYSGYGQSFIKWIFDDNPRPYNSFGNGSAMRISPLAFAINNNEQLIDLTKKVTAVSHNHPEGIKGAEATSQAIFMAINKCNKNQIKEFINKNYYPMDFTLDQIREDYEFNPTCQDSVPQAMEAFFESLDFEDAIRNAISIGGDSDTIGAICGSISQAYYGIPNDIRTKAIEYINEDLLEILLDFEKAYM